MTLKPFLNTKPTGVTISDSYNHPDFPYDGVQVDKSSTINLINLTKGLLTSINNDYKITKYLPFHYVIEFYRNTYIVHNTRPIHIQYPKGLVGNPKHVHICIIGDSNSDVYVNELYYKIYNLVILPIQKIHKLSFKTSDMIVFNTGSNFFKSSLEHYI